MSHEIALEIRSKKLAVLIRDARTASGRSKRECADALGVTAGIYNSYEAGRRSPSLPELEALAYFLDVPVSHFWGNTAISEAEPVEAISSRIARSLELRQRIVSVKLQQLREQAGLSQAELSRKSGISTGRLRNFESGEHPIPLPELEYLALILNNSVQVFSGSQGPVGEWMREQAVIQGLLEMPEDLQEFVSKPINRPYLEIAQRLSAMEVNKLRTVAEGLLDITL